MNSELRETAFACARVFAFAAVPVFVGLAAGVSAAPNLAEGRAIVVAALMGAGAAGARALYGAIRSGQIPFRNFGV